MRKTNLLKLFLGCYFLRTGVLPRPECHSCYALSLPLPNFAFAYLIPDIMRPIFRAVFLLVIILSSCKALGQRVVSLLPSATFSAVQMGADANIVGRTSYCPAASNGVKTRIVGDAMTVNVEAIIALSPDVVIASPFTSQHVVQRLRSLGLKVVSLPTPKDFNEVCSQFLVVGKLTAHEAEASRVVLSEQEAVKAISAKFANSSHLHFYFQIGAKPLWGATSDYFISDIARKLGGSNVLAVGEGACSREAVVSRKPDVVVVSSLGGLAVGEVGIWHKVTSAMTVVVDENVLCCPTPVFFRQSLQIVADALGK